jgi:hypothetical protein
MAARFGQALMTRLQLRAGLAGAWWATALAAGAALTLASSGSSSPDADAKTTTTAARLAKPQTNAKTALAKRALKDNSANLNDCMMMCSDEFVETVVEKSSVNATPAPADSTVRGVADACFESVVAYRSAVGLICTAPDKERGPEPCGVRASLSLGSREANRLL